MNSPNPVIVCASDEDFAIHMTVMLKSAVKNTSRPLTIYVLDGGIKEATKERIKESLEPNEFQLHWISVDETSLKKLKVSGHIPIQTYYRLLMPELLPKTLDKVIYLDCDMVILKDLATLWDIDVVDVPLYAVGAQYMKTGLVSYKELNINPKSKYFNAGFLYINLEYWRNFGIGDKVITFIETNPQLIRYHDQDGLNIILVDQWEELDPRWNVLTPTCVVKGHPAYYNKAKFYDNTRNCIPIEDRSEIDRIIIEPYIIHYAAGEKPWHYGCNLPYTEDYNRYLDMTVWKGTRQNLIQKITRDYLHEQKVYGKIRAPFFFFIHLLLEIKYKFGAFLRKNNMIS